MSSTKLVQCWIADWPTWGILVEKHTNSTLNHLRLGRCINLNRVLYCSIWLRHVKYLQATRRLSTYRTSFMNIVFTFALDYSTFVCGQRAVMRVLLDLDEQMDSIFRQLDCLKGLVVFFSNLMKLFHRKFILFARALDSSAKAFGKKYIDDRPSLVNRWKTYIWPNLRVGIWLFFCRALNKFGTVRTSYSKALGTTRLFSAASAALSTTSTFLKVHDFQYKGPFKSL